MGSDCIWNGWMLTHSGPSPTRALRLRSGEECVALNPVPDVALFSMGDCEESPDWLILVSGNSLLSIGEGWGLQMEPLRPRVITVSAVCVGPLICSSYSWWPWSRQLVSIFQPFPNQAHFKTCPTKGCTRSLTARPFSGVDDLVPSASCSHLIPFSGHEPLCSAKAKHLW